MAHLAQTPAVPFGTARTNFGQLEGFFAPWPLIATLGALLYLAALGRLLLRQFEHLERPARPSAKAGASLGWTQVET